ncbi:MAG: hydrogenobyrinic acid a,c-diamide synthase (glutamine-hydrolyzing) [Candidatus Hydrothermarchaeota archaeon]|nr:hydrogenobyrinic acid a,c-diamide synthase (glutamine-hydrolyzing) [Candidatus Hydrothermarchaeota archaeon]
MKIPRIILTGTSSRAGKTVVSIGLMRALVNRGYVVQPYKAGPDFIDPSFHLFATQRYSRNIDGFMMRSEDMLESFQRNSKDADIAVIEGTMGLYDSHNALDEKGSTAEASKILKAPVILIANVERIARTAAPFVMGYKLFDPAVDIRGVILNRVGSERHADKVKLAVEKLADMRVIGVMPRDPGISIPERHLGLVPAFERSDIEALFDRLAEIMEEYIDIDGIIDIAETAPKMRRQRENNLFNPPNKFDVRVGIMRDNAFTFYYQDVIDALAANSRKITIIDALKDEKLPDVDALYIGGGFPEVFAEDLENNGSLRGDVRDFCDSGKPVYAECGGLMYLGERLITKDGRSYEMAGFLPLDTKMMERLQALGYSRRTAIMDNPISRRGDALVGHEFHYSRVTLKDKVKYAYKTTRGRGVDGEHDGILKKNTLAGYLHLHVLSYPKMLENFLSMAENISE